MTVYHIIGNEADYIDEYEASKEDTLDMASTLDSRVNGSVANGTIHTIPKTIEKTDECSNGENSSPYPPLLYAAPFAASTNFASRQNNKGFQRVPNECPVPNKHYPGSSDANLDHVKPSILQNAAAPTTTRDEKFVALQHNHTFAPLHVECDSVGNTVCYLKNFMRKKYNSFFFL